LCLRRGTWRLKVRRLIPQRIQEFSLVGSRTLIRSPVWLIWLSAVNVLDGFTLAKIAGDEVIVNTINPGFCHSELTRDLNGIQALFVKCVIVV